MRSLRTRRPVALVPPRPLRTTRCSISTREELIGALELIDQAYETRQDSDGRLAIDIVATRLYRAEPDLRGCETDLALAASIGASLHTASSPHEAGGDVSGGRSYVDFQTWNTIAWAGIELSCRLPARYGAFADYFVRVGHYLAFGGLSAVRDVERELDSWAQEYLASTGTERFTAMLDGQPVAEFWIDSAGRAQGTSMLPQRPAASPERLYDELIFDLAWDDFHNAALDAGRPRATRPLPNMLQIQWTPQLVRLARPAPSIQPAVVSSAVDTRPRRARPAPEPDLALIFSGGDNGASTLHDYGVADSACFKPGTSLSTGPAVEPVIERVQPPVVQPLVQTPVAVQQHAVAQQPVVQPAAAQVSMAPPPPAAAWFADPLQRYVYRWWDGSAWTAMTSDGHQVILDLAWSEPASQR